MIGYPGNLFLKAMDELTLVSEITASKRKQNTLSDPSRTACITNGMAKNRGDNLLGCRTGRTHRECDVDKQFAYSFLLDASR